MYFLFFALDSPFRKTQLIMRIIQTIFPMSGGRRSKRVDAKAQASFPDRLLQIFDVFFNLIAININMQLHLIYYF